MATSWRRAQRRAATKRDEPGPFITHRGGQQIIRPRWNGQPCTARIVRVIVADNPLFPRYWAKSLVGVEVEAVEISGAQSAAPQPFYLYNGDGSGWRKVTEGKGSPAWPHKTLFIESVITEESER